MLEPLLQENFYAGFTTMLIVQRWKYRNKSCCWPKSCSVLPPHSVNWSGIRSRTQTVPEFLLLIFLILWCVQRRLVLFGLGVLICGDLSRTPSGSNVTRWTSLPCWGQWPAPDPPAPAAGASSVGPARPARSPVWPIQAAELHSQTGPTNRQNQDSDKKLDLCRTDFNAKIQSALRKWIPTLTELNQTMKLGSWRGPESVKWWIHSLMLLWLCLTHVCCDEALFAGGPGSEPLDRHNLTFYF